MSTYKYGGDPPGLAGKYHYGVGSVGVPGALIPSTGTNGAGYGRSSVASPADDAKEYYFPITSIPAGLTIDTSEDTGFTASAPDGVYVVPFDEYELGVKLGSSSFTLTFGVGVFLTGAPTTGGATSGSGAVTVTPAAGAINLTAAPTTGGAVSSGGAVSVAPAVPPVNLTGAPTTGGATSGSGAISVTAYIPQIINLVGAPTTGGAISGSGALMPANAPPVIHITRTMLVTALRAFIMSIVGGVRVIRTPVNRAAMPTDAFIALTPGAVIPLATTTHAVVAGEQQIKRSSQFNCQVDCYGIDSGDMAETITMLFRDAFAADYFARQSFEIAPLFADDEHQLPIVTGEEQYVERWSFNVALQFNPIVTTSQQSANMLTVGIISVDATYPP